MVHSITAQRCLITVGPAAMPAVPRRVFPQVVHRAGILPVLVFLFRAELRLGIAGLRLTCDAGKYLATMVYTKFTLQAQYIYLQLQVCSSYTGGLVTASGQDECARVRLNELRQAEPDGTANRHSCPQAENASSSH